MQLPFLFLEEANWPVKPRLAKRAIESYSSFDRQSVALQHLGMCNVLNMFSQPFIDPTPPGIEPDVGVCYPGCLS